MILAPSGAGAAGWASAGLLAGSVALAVPATNPAATQIQFSQLPAMFLRSEIPSIIMLLPRETMSATIPQANAPANAEESPTRYAMFEIGSFVKSQL